MESTLTLWFLTAANPAEVLSAEHKADRGFGRKYLSQLNPAWPIVPIGQFPLNRSAPASQGEYYVAGFPGVAVVQTLLRDTPQLSELPARLLDSIPAAEVIAIAINEDTGYGGFAQWHGGVLKRSLCATRTRTFEDIGLPIPFESPFWAGETAQPLGGITLPFEPVKLARAAQNHLLGIEITTTGPDVNVVAYAVDGRPEAKEPTPRPRALVVGSESRATYGEQIPSGTGAKDDSSMPKPLGSGPGSVPGSEDSAGYDDYEQHDSQLQKLSDEIADSSPSAAREEGKKPSTWSRLGEQVKGFFRRRGRGEN